MPFFDDAVYTARRQRVADAVRRAGHGPVVLGTGAEFEYLTGSAASSHERLTALVFGPDGVVTAIAPLTDIESLRKGASLADVPLEGWRDGDNPYALVARAARATASSRVQLGSSLTADHVFGLRDAFGTAGTAGPAGPAGTVEPLCAEVRDCFLIKDDAEIAQLARAAAAIDRVHARVPELLVPGATEEAVAAELHRLILEEHRSVDFVIVGGGENGANPHHDFSPRVLREGDPVVVDLGGTLDSGYHSDCTRIYVVGGRAAADGEFAAAFDAAFDAVHRAHEAALAAARPGMTAGELDAVARGVIEDAGYGEYFTHRLGHGIGLAGHEAPFIIGGGETVLREHMVFSIEPGVYLPGAFGVRIEDIVVLEADRARALNQQPRGL